MFSNLVKKSDIVDQRNMNKYNTNSPEVTQAIMADGVVDKKTLIQAIEKYNSTHKLPLSKRVQYCINIGNTYINIVHAYFLSDTDLVVVGWNSMGFAMTMYEDGKVKHTLNDVSTYVMKVEDISAVEFGSYDPSKVTVFSEDSLKQDDNERYRALSELRSDLNGLKVSGHHRSIIIKTNVEMVKRGLNDATLYLNNYPAYNMYMEIAQIYIERVTEIVQYFINPNLNTNADIYHKFKFYKTEDIRKDAIAKFDAATDVEKFRDRISDENTFTYDEVTELAKVIGNTNTTTAVTNMIASKA